MPIVSGLTEIAALVVPLVVKGAGMAKASRDKGARGERELVRLLRPVVPEGWTVRRALPYELGHDLRIVDELGTAVPGGWAIECKRYADFSVGEVLRGPSSRWLGWWDQTRRQADQVGRAAMLCTRGDRRPWWVWMRHTFPRSVPYVELTLDDGSSVCGTLLAHVLDDIGQQMRGSVEEVHALREGAE